MKTKTISILFALMLAFHPVSMTAQEAASGSSNEADMAADFDYFQKYRQYLKYKKKKKYEEYKEAKEKYGFETSAQRLAAKDAYRKYKQFKKNPAKFAAYARFLPQYEKYKKYKNKYAPLKKYSKYSKYNKSKYDKYKKYGSSEYKAGHDRYLAAQKSQPVAAGTLTNFGEANLGGGALGPEISVGLFSTAADDLTKDPFKIKANKPYVAKNSSGETVAGPIAADVITRVTWAENGKLRIYNSVPDVVVAGEVTFEPADSDISSSVFDIYRPDSSFDQYRGKMKARYSTTSKNVWMINLLPLELYVWGMGEITGTGDDRYDQVMTTSFRTYGYWKIKYSTKFATEGFKVNATPGNQLYYGYDWETGHEDIKKAALATQGVLMMHSNSENNRIAITPYSSWTDGRTRSFEERWGSKDYPWCQSVSDPYGKHSSLSTKELQDRGNHMVGLSAHGALSLAGNHGWDYQKIMGYYYNGVNFIKAYQ